MDSDPTTLHLGGGDLMADSKRVRLMLLFFLLGLVLFISAALLIWWVK
jgi:hypothetical protein